MIIRNFSYLPKHKFQHKQSQMTKNFKYKAYDPIVSLLIKDKINESEFIINIFLTCSGLDLKKEIQNEKETLFFDKIRLITSGFLINDFFSLQYQGIQNGSVIYLIPENEKKCQYGNSKEIEFSKNLYLFSNNFAETLIEKSRLTDIYRSRIEANPKCFRKLIRKFNEMQNNANNQTLNKRRPI